MTKYVYLILYINAFFHLMEMNFLLHYIYFNLYAVQIKNSKRLSLRNHHYCSNREIYNNISSTRQICYLCRANTLTDIISTFLCNNVLYLK